MLSLEDRFNWFNWINWINIASIVAPHPGRGLSGAY